MGIGNSLNELLKKRNMRPSELADKIGISRSTINSIIKRDNNKIDIDILFRICDELRISTDEFLGYKKIDSILLNKEEEEIISAYRVCYCKEVIQRALGIMPEIQKSNINDTNNTDIDSEITNEFVSGKNFTKILEEQNTSTK